ncbi:MAG TPA: hypothetical protein VJK03_02460 [Candidatus Nanoarchaeia archaeon]|nr:hypothetical protein [Candidatus Nanoarchaeia archaeon]
MVKRGDYVQQLVEYLRKNLRKGYTMESLRWALINQGHSKLEVDKAIMRLEEELSQEAPVLNTKPEITYEVIEPPDAIIEKKPWWKRFFGR